MDLFLRRVIHPQAHNNFRAILKADGIETEVGSIGIQHGSGSSEYWAWAIDSPIPMRDVDTQGTGKDRRDCTRQFRVAWDKLAADPACLTEFLREKRKRLR